MGTNQASPTLQKTQILMNSDEAKRCLSISKEQFDLGNAAKALKLAHKSIALHDSPQAQEWLQHLLAQPKQRKPAAKKEESKESLETKEKEPEFRPYTQVQVDTISNILQMKRKGDLYGVLNLEKTATDVEIKKAYRKLALQCHPDKCSAPGTDDAFKAIANSFSVLEDADKRAHFDRYGIDSAESSSGTPSQSHAQQFRGFGGEFNGGQVSPEELFRMFMGDDFPGFSILNLI